jgi:hypothetical protein
MLTMILLFRANMPSPIATEIEIDPLHFESAVQLVPSAGFMGMDDGALGDPRLDE